MSHANPMLRPVLIFAVSAMFLGLGLGRFAFSPLIPELVGAGWLEVPAAQAIGAANLIGYFAGAVLARPALRLMDERRLCILSGGLVVLSYGMFAAPLGFGGFWLARFLSGVGGGVLMVVATSAAARQLAVLGRHRLQSLVFVGIGLGALFAALFLPPLLRHGLGVSLLALLGFSAVVLALLWGNSGFLSRRRMPKPPADRRIGGISRGVVLIIIAYGCDALGFVMHTVYLPDMLRRAFGYTEAQVGIVWAFFGIGACASPVFVMVLRRLLSMLNALWLAFALKAGAVALVLVTADPVSASLSLFIIGMLTPGIVMLTSGALAALAPPERYLALWAGATALFAMCQMIGGMVIATISAQGYDLALILSVMVLMLGAALSVTAGFLTKQERR